jgi:hypothetical protein
VRKTGRAAMGVRLLNLPSESDRVVGLAKIDSGAQALDDEEDIDLVGDAELANPAPSENGEQPKLGFD